MSNDFEEAMKPVMKMMQQMIEQVVERAEEEKEDDWDHDNVVGTLEEEWVHVDLIQLMEIMTSDRAPFTSPELKSHVVRGRDKNDNHCFYLFTGTKSECKEFIQDFIDNNW